MRLIDIVDDFCDVSLLNDVINLLEEEKTVSEKCKG